MTTPHRWLGAHADRAYALMRIVVALLYLQHGLQKLLPVLGGPVAHSPLFITAGFIESLCGFAILIGFQASWAAFLASGEMAVAYFLFHAPHSFWTILNHGEIVVAFCFVFLYVAVRGAGPWSVDGLGEGRRET